MRDAIASSKSEPEEQRAARTGPQLVPLDTTADAILQFEKESPDSEDADDSDGETAEPARIAVFPTDALAARAENAEPGADSVEVEAPPPPRNWRGVLLPLLAIAVVAQGALMAYWALSNR